MHLPRKIFKRSTSSSQPTRSGTASSSNRAGLSQSHHQPPESVPRASSEALNPPIHASFPSSHLTIAAGVAIFQIATARVVVVYHRRDRYYFLPKGRKDSGESLEHTCVREGFEESGYRSRLVGGLWAHRQPLPEVGQEEPAAQVQRMNDSGQAPEVAADKKGSLMGTNSDPNMDPAPFYSIDPIHTQILPFPSRRNPGAHYLLFWFIAETLPPNLQDALDKRQPSRHIHVAPLPHSTTISARKKEEQEQDQSKHEDSDLAAEQKYEPVRAQGTGVDDEERWYEGRLMRVEDALQVLGGSQRDVVKRGWEGLMERQREEDEQDEEG